MGVTPNMTKAMANSAALLKGYLDLSGALGKGVVHPATREQIAIAVAQDNACSYCLSAHVQVAAGTGGKPSPGPAPDPAIDLVKVGRSSVPDGRG